MIEQPKKITFREVLNAFLAAIVFPFLPLLISGHWNWWEAWVYGFVSFLGFILSRGLAARKNPQMIKDRVGLKNLENTQPWDRILAPLVMASLVLIPLVAGLEALFKELLSFSLGVKIAILAILISGYVLGSYALIENAYFAMTVRLQPGRGQHVISGGPYRWMRHPGYAGTFMIMSMIPLFLGSEWGFLPAVVGMVALIIRTKLEDDFLQKELAGYEDYAKKVRFRLIPGIW